MCSAQCICFDSCLNYEGMQDVKPFVIGIWSGVGKPKNLTEFLLPLVNDINILIREGISINGYRIDSTIRSFLCDSPARSFLKGLLISFVFYASACQRHQL